MNILGIDYGRKKVGLAMADGPLAEPYRVVLYEDKNLLIEEIKKIIEKERIEKIVVGISEGEMGEESKEFSLDLTSQLNVPIETFDETLSTQEAQRLSIEANIKRSKRLSLEDAFAAAVMLQGYLDSK